MRRDIVIGHRVVAYVRVRTNTKTIMRVAGDILLVDSIVAVGEQGVIQDKVTACLARGRVALNQDVSFHPAHMAAITYLG